MALGTGSVILLPTSPLASLMSTSSGDDDDDDADAAPLLVPDGAEISSHACDVAADRDRRVCDAGDDGDVSACVVGSDSTEAEVSYSCYSDIISPTLL